MDIAIRILALGVALIAVRELLSLARLRQAQSVPGRARTVYAVLVLIVAIPLVIGGIARMAVPAGALDAVTPETIFRAIFWAGAVGAGVGTVMMLFAGDLASVSGAMGHRAPLRRAGYYRAVGLGIIVAACLALLFSR